MSRSTAPMGLKLSAPGAIGWEPADTGPGTVGVIFECAVVGLGDACAIGAHNTTDQPLPRVLGCSAVGRVCETVASEGHAEIQPGTRVVVSSVGSCGDGGRGGVWRQWMLLDADQLFPIAEEVDPRAASLAFEVASAVHAIDRNDVSGCCVAILGAGTTGLHALSVALARGARRVVVVDPDPDKRAAAIALGASDACSADDYRAALTCQRLAQPAVVADFTGAAESVSDALEFVGPAGSVVVTGTPDDGVLRISRYYATLIDKEVRLLGSYSQNPADRRNAIDLIEREKVTAPRDSKTYELGSPEALRALTDLSAAWNPTPRIYLEAQRTGAPVATLG